MPPAPPTVAAYSPQELWYFNGVSLMSQYWNIATLGGSRFSLPVLRGQNYEVPYRAGQVWRPKYPDQRTVTLAMWLNGVATSSIAYPAPDARLAFNNNLQSIRQLFWTRQGAGGSLQGQLQRNWYLTQGTNKLVTSTAMAEIAGSMDLTMSGRTHAGFSVDLLLSDPYFYGAQQTQACTGASTTCTALGEGVVGEGQPSAVSSFTIQLSAACTVTNASLSPVVAFTFSAAGAQYPVTIDVLNYTATDNAGINQVAGLTHTGSRMWMVLLPGANTIQVSAGTATFRWTDAYI
jgi:hypothetical protein